MQTNTTPVIADVETHPSVVTVVVVTSVVWKWMLLSALICEEFASFKCDNVV